MEKHLSSKIPGLDQQRILIHGEENYERKVYRVAKWGVDDSKSFLSSYEEYLLNPDGLSKPDLSEIGGYATSCNSTIKIPKKLLKFLKRKYFNLYPHPIIVVGKTIMGLSQETYRRIPNYSDKTHVDWWIYSGSESVLTKIFEIVDIEGNTNEVKQIEENEK